MSSWTFYNAVRDAMRRMAAERDELVAGRCDNCDAPITFEDAHACARGGKDRLDRRPPASTRR